MFENETLTYNIFQDWKVNKGNTKGRIILISFRLAVLIRSRNFFVVLFFFYLLFYRVFIEWILGIELHWNVKAGRNLFLAHGQGTVLNGGTTIGKSCTLRHCTTIGHKINKDGSFSSAPKIGNNVNIGANVCIIGGVTVGDKVVIGAGSIVTKDIPSNCTVVGNPARVIFRSDNQENII